jgi:hypothetical protein
MIAAPGIKLYKGKSNHGEGGGPCFESLFKHQSKVSKNKKKKKFFSSVLEFKHYSKMREKCE